MSNKLQDLSEKLQTILASQIQTIVVDCNEITIEVASENLVSVATTLRDHDDLAFEQLIDLCGVDYIAYGKTEWSTDGASATGFSRGVEPADTGRLRFGDELNAGNNDIPRFASVIHLISYRHNHRLRLRSFAKDNQFPLLPSVIDVWNSANWYEREAFDLYGIVYENHPDLRRILTDYGFVGHPFRKDFPLIGNVEMRYDPEQQRVIYEPVSIEPRVLVPRVIREDNRYLHAQNEQNKEGATDA
ncbi:MAG: NADH-quinone oxidoreductase subunit C [Gammaproteobacteria bacterium]|nr:NADH-quinone oxidoreductase subunit C [Gammaproteobacteria bacterium]